MLTDPKEIELVSCAMEPGIRVPHRSCHGPSEIVRDFMGGRRFDGEHVLELGPGHYEFCEYMRARGGRASVVELDPCLAELGRWRKFGVHVLDLRELPKLEVAQPFDGLFCKGSNNPFWFHGDRKALERYIDSFLRLVRPSGWIWVASCPWSADKLTTADFDAWLAVERDLYLARGFKEWAIPSKSVGGYYGISVPCPRLSVFTLGLPGHRWTLPLLAWVAAYFTKRGVAKVLRAGRGRSG